MFSSAKLILALASLTPLASAWNTNLHAKLTWGCSSNQRQVTPSNVRDQCSGLGAFLTGFGAGSICSSPNTRIPPRDVTCPLNGWFQHSKQKCCVPKEEVSECDCGEDNLKCNPVPGKCGGNQWWHPRSNSCCDTDWKPHRGECPKGKRCPTNWYWDVRYKQCKPEHSRCPEPDCDDWDHHNQCCGGGNHPSGIPTPPGGGGYPTNPQPPSNGGGYGGYPTQPQPPYNGGGGGGYGGHGWKRDAAARRSLDQQVSFPQTNLDKMYCPGNLHACSVNTDESSEWSYECIDPATELESCGGCASTGEGVDCTKIPNAGSVGCTAGVCEILSCQSGYNNNGTACIAA